MLPTLFISWLCTNILATVTTHTHTIHVSISLVKISQMDSLFMVNILVMILITTWRPLPTKFQTLNVFITFHSYGLTQFWIIMPVSLPIKVFVIQVFKHKAVLHHHKRVSTYHMYQLHVCWIWLKIWCYCTALNLSHVPPRGIKLFFYKWTLYEHHL